MRAAGDEGRVPCLNGVQFCLLSLVSLRDCLWGSHGTLSRRELKGTIHCSCHHPVPGCAPNHLLELLLQERIHLSTRSLLAPPPTPLPSAFASTSSPLSCPTKLRLWVLAMQGNSHDLQRTRHFHCHRLFFLLPSFCTLGIFHEVKITM